ncbi:GDSL-type esterase/lipase family protein [Clostridium kluyveri]|uniref:Hydrolase n=1 Tax=Clostridium kluyveri TaxID=1534 RepID=A0A1L5FAD6_CLOKL|nr:GDSL-type esterase/lipase family protein [Clostridium kluyveri]APM39981.1 hydrolase [Clostridium kluyveri]
MKLICLGDSLTSGYGVFKEDCWVSLIRDLLKIEVLNKGINGDTMPGMSSRSYRDVVNNHPTHVIILGGSNDFMAGRRLKLVTDNLTEIIKESLNEGIIPIVGTEPIIDKTLAERKWDGTVDYDKINILLNHYRNWILDFCTKNNIYYIDLYTCFLEQLKTTDNSSLFIDGIHPTKTGHKLIAECILNFFRTL